MTRLYNILLTIALISLYINIQCYAITDEVIKQYCKTCISRVDSISTRKELFKQKRESIVLIYNENTPSFRSILLSMESICTTYVLLNITIIIINSITIIY